MADVPLHVLLPAMEPEPAIGGWSIPAPEEVVAPLEPAAYVPEAAPVWEAEVEVVAAEPAAEPELADKSTVEVWPELPTSALESEPPVEAEAVAEAEVKRS